MPGPAFLVGDRVTLRTVTEADHRLFERAHNEPAFRDGLLFRTPQGSEDVASFVDERTDDGNVLLVVCVEEDDGGGGGDAGEADTAAGTPVPVGAVSLSEVAREHATLAYWLVPEARGEGYATAAAGLLVDYAFDTLSLHHLVAWTVAGNDDSQAVLERLGFVEEGRLREHVYWDGAYRDAVYFGLLEGEWESV